MSHWVVCASLLLKEYDDVSKVDTNQLLLSAAIAQKKDRSRFGLKVGAVRAIHRCDAVSHVRTRLADTIAETARRRPRPPGRSP